MRAGTGTLAAVLEPPIRERCFPYASAATDPFVAYFRARFGRPLLAVIAYGSRLSEVTASATSILDFFVICSDYRRFYRAGGMSALHAALNSVLPPNIYEIDLPDPAAREPKPRCKYCVISLRGLEGETGPAAKDLYHLGRFSKRVGICYAKGPRTLDRLVAVLVRSTLRMAALALPRLPAGRPFRLDEFARELLGLSYLGERRIEAGDKVEKLFRAEEEHYRRVYGVLLETLAERGEAALAGAMNGASPPSETPWIVRAEGGGGGGGGGRGLYRLVLDKGRRLRQKNAGERLLASSRLRGQLRWPKYIVTYEKWVDYVLQKIARTQGIEIALTERERRHPLIAGLRHYRRLRKQRLLQ